MHQVVTSLSDTKGNENKTAVIDDVQGQEGKKEAVDEIEHRIV